MPLTHYPKTVYNTVLSWVQPPPPDGKRFHGQPCFSDINRFRHPLAPGREVVACHDGVNFTRFYASFFCDQPLLIVVSFSNDDADAVGNYVTDETMPDLHYDAEALRHSYDPAKQAQSGRAFWTIYGRWLRVSITNTGSKPTEKLRVHVKGSVF